MMKRMRKKQGLAALVLMALFVMLAGCGKEELADLDSVDVEITQETVILDETAQITAELSYPVVSAAAKDTTVDKVLEKLNTQFQQDAEAFVQQAEEYYLSGGVQAGVQFVYSAEVRYNTKGMLSVVQCESFVGEQYLQYAATYNLGNGEKMTMGEIMDMKEAEAQETVAKMFCGVAQSDPDTFHDDAEDYINANIDQVQYYRCNEGLGVFFQAGAIAPESAGILEMVMQ